MNAKGFRRAPSSTPSQISDQRLIRSLSPMDSSSPSEQLLLHHFANEASRVTSCHPLIQSSFNSILLPMATSYPPLLSALLTLSLIHRTSLSPPPSSSFNTDQSLEDSIIGLKAMSITKLRSSLLPSSTSLQDEHHANGILATALTLCMCEIRTGGDIPRSWRLHFEGASAILSQYATSRSTGQFDPNSTSGLLKRWYDSVEALAAITSKGLRAGRISSPSLVSSSTMQCDIDMTASEEQAQMPDLAGEQIFLDDYYGFCTDLVQTFKEIGAAAWERRSLYLSTGPSTSPSALTHPILSSSDLDNEAESLEQTVKEMLSRDATTPPRFYPGIREKLTPDLVREFYKCNEAYQYTALLYIYRRVQQLDKKDDKVQWCVKNILSCAGEIRPRNGLSPYIVLVPPLFAAGQEAFGDDRETVRVRMREFCDILKLKNVRRSLEVLECGWENGVDLQGTLLDHSLFNNTLTWF